MRVAVPLIRVIVLQVSQTVFTSFKARGMALIMDKEARKSVPGLTKQQHRLDASAGGAIGL